MKQHNGLGEGIRVLTHEQSQSERCNAEGRKKLKELVEMIESEQHKSHKGLKGMLEELRTFKDMIAGGTEAEILKATPTVALVLCFNQLGIRWVGEGTGSTTECREAEIWRGGMDSAN